MIALAARALEVAGQMTDREPVGRTPGGYLPVCRDRGRCEAIAEDSAAGDVMQIINPLRSETAYGYSAWWVWTTRVARSHSKDRRQRPAAHIGRLRR